MTADSGKDKYRTDQHGRPRTSIKSEIREISNETYANKKDLEKKISQTGLIRYYFFISVGSMLIIILLLFSGAFLYFERQKALEAKFMYRFSVLESELINIKEVIYNIEDKIEKIEAQIKSSDEKVD